MLELQTVEIDAPMRTPATSIAIGDDVPSKMKKPGDRAATGQWCDALEGHFAKTQDWRFGS
jgi:hypothetical protein